MKILKIGFLIGIGLLFNACVYKTVVPATTHSYCNHCTLEPRVIQEYVPVSKYYYYPCGYYGGYCR